MYGCTYDLLLLIRLKKNYIDCCYKRPLYQSIVKLNVLLSLLR
jgi:hypothetical protein